MNPFDIKHLSVEACSPFSCVALMLHAAPSPLFPAFSTRLVQPWDCIGYMNLHLFSHCCPQSVLPGPILVIWRVVVLVLVCLLLGGFDSYISSHNDTFIHKVKFKAGKGPAFSLVWDAFFWDPGPNC